MNAVESVWIRAVRAARSLKARRLQPPVRRKPLFEALEQRFLLSGEGLIIPPPPPPSVAVQPALEASLVPTARALVSAVSVPVDFALPGARGSQDATQDAAQQAAAAIAPQPDPSGITDSTPSIVAIDPVIAKADAVSGEPVATVEPPAATAGAAQPATVQTAEGTAASALVTASARSEVEQRMSLASYAERVNSLPPPSQIVVIDAAVPDYEALVRAIASLGASPENDETAPPALQPDSGPAERGLLPPVLESPAQARPGEDDSPQVRVSRVADIEVVVLDARYDGIDQISRLLAPHQGLAAVQVVSHGGSGSLRLGSTQLTTSRLEALRDRVSGWGSALSSGADILLYGCDVAGGAPGIEFVQRFAAITGADVAASTDATGSAARAGDWALEYTTGAIEVAPLLQGADISALLGGSYSITGSTLSFSGSSGGDTLNLRVNGSGVLEFRWDSTGAYTAVAFGLSTGTINVNLGSGDDAFIFDDASSLGAVALSVQGEDGADSVTLNENLTLSGGLVVAAESIVLSSGFTVSTGAGNVSLTALAQDATQVTTSAALTARTASIQVLGSLVATSGNITLFSEVTRNIALSGTVTAAVASTSDASVVVSGTVSTAGAMSLTARTGGTVTASAAGLLGLSASNTFTDNAVVRISNSAGIDVGSLTLLAETKTSYTATSRSALNSVSGQTQAYIEGSTVNTRGAGGLTISANDDASLTARSPDMATDLSGSLPVSIAASVARNELDRDVEAYIDSITVQAAAGGGVSASALKSAALTAIAEAKTLSASAVFTGSLSVSGTYAGNVVLGDVNAYVSGGSVSTAGAGAVGVEARDTMEVRAIAETAAQAGSGLAQISDSSAVSIGYAIAFNAIGWDMPDSFVGGAVEALIGSVSGAAIFGTNVGAGTHAYVEDSVVSAGGAITVKAENAATLSSAVSNALTFAGAGVLTGASGSASGGIVSLNKVSSASTASIGFTSGYAGARTITGGAGVTVLATDDSSIDSRIVLAAASAAANPNPFLKGDAIGVSGAVALNEVRGGATATIDRATVAATTGNVRVAAIESASLTALLRSEAKSSASTSLFGGTGNSLAASGLIATNVVVSAASATISNSVVSTSGADGNVEVDAQNTASIGASVDNAVESGGKAIGVTLAFNTIGWQAQNVLFNTVDALIGDPAIANAFGTNTRSDVKARIVDSTVEAAGQVKVTAKSEASLTSLVNNVTSTSVGSTLTGASGLSVGAVVSLNKVSSAAEASIGYGTGYAGAKTISASAGVTVSAEDAAEIAATTTLATRSSAVTGNPFADGASFAVSGAV